MSIFTEAGDAITSLLGTLTSALGFWGILGVTVGVELLFVIFFAIKSAFSYEARLRKSLDKLNTWLFSVRTINESNIKRFNSLVKTGPKRLVYYWQQFILYREGGAKDYLTEENLIKKPLQTSSWAGNVKNLSILTFVWAFISAVIGFVICGASGLNGEAVALALIFPMLVLIVGVTAILVIRSTRASNLDEIYHLHHLFIRFIQNACAELPPYIDFNLLFTPKEIEKGNVHLREYYEERARQAKKEFDEARANDVKYVEYNFDAVGVDGKLLLNRAMRESEKFINKKTKILSQIAQVETQKDTLRRNYENIQIDLQRKIQVSKENIKSLIEKQAATTSRIEAQLLKQQQDKEIAKQADLQKDYDQEESRYSSSREEFDKQIEQLNLELEKSMEDATAGMSSEYQTFFEKVMQNAYVFADKKVASEKENLLNEKDKCEDELIAVQTQIKHLLDENNVLRGRLENFDPKYKQKLKSKNGKYVNGVFVGNDGTYHDENGFFHDKDGKVYNSLGEVVSHDESPEERDAREVQELKEEQAQQFGAFVPEVQAEEEKVQTQEDASQTPETQEEIHQEVVEEIHEDVKEENKEDAGEEALNQNVITENEQIQEVENGEKSEDDKAEQDVIPENATVEGVDFEELFGYSNEEETPAQTQESESQTEEPQQPQTVEPQPETTEEKFGFDDLFASQDEEAIEKPKEEQVEEKQTEQAQVEPAKKRGRPRKVVTEQESQEKKRRGRPRKEVATQEVVPAKKRGRPRKTAQAESDGQATPKKTKRKSVVKNQTPAKKRGRPRKSDIADQEIDTLARINQLIHEEEAKLKNMKSIINNQLDEAIEKATQSKIEEERREILSQVEELQTQAIEAQHSGKVEEFSSINSKIEVLINRLAELNKR